MGTGEQSESQRMEKAAMITLVAVVCTLSCRLHDAFRTLANVVASLFMGHRTYGVSVGLSCSRR